jgi:WD40 repeat protein
MEQSGASATRLIAPAHAFGLQPNVQNNILAVDETTVCYPVGRAIVLFNTDTKKMAFVREGTQEKGEITALAIAPSKKYLAVCERAEHATVSVYHIASQRRTKQLPQGSPLDVGSSEFVTAAFSGDSKMLAAITGDFAIALWLWDKGRLLALQKNQLAASFSINRVSFNPADSNTIATTGPKFFKLWRYADGQLKVWNVNLHKGREHQGYTDHCWLPGEDRCAACTDNGEIFLVEKGELKVVLTSAATQAGVPKLLCIQPFARGFLTSGEGGQLCVFEGPKDDKEIYVLTHTFSCSQVAAGGGGAVGGREKLDITSLTVTPSEELLYVASANAQLASLCVPRSRRRPSMRRAGSHPLPCLPSPAPATHAHTHTPAHTHTHTLTQPRPSSPTLLCAPAARSLTSTFSRPRTSTSPSSPRRDFTPHQSQGSTAASRSRC